MSFTNGNSVVDSAALALLEAPFVIEPGTRVFNEGVDAYFVYTISDAELVTDEIVAVAGISDARWILDGSDVPGSAIVVPRQPDDWSFGDEDVTIAPGTDEASQYTFTSGIFTESRTVTVSTTDTVEGSTILIVVDPQESGVEVAVENAAEDTLFTFQNSDKRQAAMFRTADAEWVFVSFYFAAA